MAQHVPPLKAPPPLLLDDIPEPTMTPTLAIALVLLLWSPGTAAARRRRVGSGSSSYCVDDNNQRVLCENTIASIVGGAISGLCSLNHLCAGHCSYLFSNPLFPFFQFSLSLSSSSVGLSGVATSGDVRCSCLKLPPWKTTRRRAL